MVATWSAHGSDMVPKSVHSMNIGLRPCLLSLQNFRAIANLEIKLGQISVMADKCVYLLEGVSESVSEIMNQRAGPSG